MAKNRPEKASHAKHRQSAPSRQPGSPLLNLALLLALAGILLTAYLSAVHWFGERPAWCEAGAGCDLVQDSRYSVLFALPLAFWGLLTYAGVAGFVALARHRPRYWFRAWLLAAMGAGLSLYFTALSVFDIQALCPWCLASTALMLALVVVLALARPADRGAPPLASAAVSGSTVGLVLIGLLHLHWSGAFDPAAGPEDPWLRGLASHLEASGAKFYGAYWCPHCQEQKDAFGASAARLPYVECSPGGPKGPQASACAEAGIRNYPTWIINGRQHGGTLSPQTLAKRSGFSPAPK